MHHSKPTTSSCGRCTHSQHNPCPTELTSCGEGSTTRERSAWWGDITQKRNKVYEVHKGGHSHAPLQTHNVVMRPVHAQPAQPLPNRTHQLRRRKDDKGGTRVGGRHNSEEKKSLGSAKGGAFPCTTPNPQRPHAAGARTASTTLAQPNSPAAAKEARQGREARGGET